MWQQSNIKMTYIYVKVRHIGDSLEVKHINKELHAYGLSRICCNVCDWLSPCWYISGKMPRLSVIVDILMLVSTLIHYMGWRFFSATLHVFYRVWVPCLESFCGLWHDLLSKNACFTNMHHCTCQNGLERISSILFMDLVFELYKNN